jgi:prepilin-type N-terminal cleavage/methylation domain-containing protein
MAEFSVKSLSLSLKKSQGFTLLEMALVVILLGILLSAAVYGFIGYQRATNNSAAKQNYQKLMTAKVVWCGQNQGGTPDLTVANGIGSYINSGTATLTPGQFSLGGTTPAAASTLVGTLKACGTAGEILEYDGLLFGLGTKIICTSTGDTPVVNSTICVSS